MSRWSYATVFQNMLTSSAARDAIHNIPVGLACWVERMNELVSGSPLHPNRCSHLNCRTRLARKWAQIILTCLTLHLGPSGSVHQAGVKYTQYLSIDWLWLYIPDAILRYWTYIWSVHYSFNMNSSWIQDLYIQHIQVSREICLQCIWDSNNNTYSLHDH